MGHDDPQQVRTLSFAKYFASRKNSLLLMSSECGHKKRKCDTCGNCPRCPQCSCGGVRRKRGRPPKRGTMKRSTSARSAALLAQTRISKVSKRDTDDCSPPSASRCANTDDTQGPSAIFNLACLALAHRKILFQNYGCDRRPFQKLSDSEKNKLHAEVEKRLAAVCEQIFPSYWAELLASYNLRSRKQSELISNLTRGISPAANLALSEGHFRHFSVLRTHRQVRSTF